MNNCHITTAHFMWMSHLPYIKKKKKKQWLCSIGHYCHRNDWFGTSSPSLIPWIASGCTSVQSLGCSVLGNPNSNGLDWKRKWKENA